MADHKRYGGAAQDVYVVGGSIEDLSLNDVPIDDLHPLPIIPASVLIDAFSRMRVSSPTGIFESTLLYDNNPVLWEDKVTAGGTSVYLSGYSAQRLRVLVSGDAVIRQSKEYFHYQPGKSQLVYITGVLGASKAGIEQRIGYFDENDGIYFAQTPDGPAIVRRSSILGDLAIPQALWSIDPFDGTGSSGVTLDFSTSQIFIVDLQWLGVGRVRVGFDIDGVVMYAHEFLNANAHVYPYMARGTLPIRYEIIATDGATQTDMLAICASVSSEGGTETELGFPFSTNTGVTGRTVTTRLPIVSIRPAATINSLVNRIKILPDAFSAYSATRSIFYELVYGGTLTNPSFAAVSAYSGVERDITASAITGGFTILSGYLEAAQGNAPGALSDNILSRLPLALDIAGAHPTTPLTDVLSFVATSIPGTETVVNAALSWRELR